MDIMNCTLSEREQVLLQEIDELKIEVQRLKGFSNVTRRKPRAEEVRTEATCAEGQASPTVAPAQGGQLICASTQTYETDFPPLGVDEEENSGDQEEHSSENNVDPGEFTILLSSPPPKPTIEERVTAIEERFTAIETFIKSISENQTAPVVVKKKKKKKKKNKIVSAEDTQKVNVDTSNWEEQTVLMGDSIIKKLKLNCPKSVVKKHCMPGATLESLTASLKDVDLHAAKTVVVHAGTNSLIRGPNGAVENADAVVAQASQLLKTIREGCPTAFIVLSSILFRRRFNDYAVNRVNEMLEKVANGMERVRFVDGNSWLGEDGLAPDGLHLNNRGVTTMSALLSKVVSSCG